MITMTNDKTWADFTESDMAYLVKKGWRKVEDRPIDHEGIAATAIATDLAASIDAEVEAQFTKRKPGRPRKE